MAGYNYIVTQLPVEDLNTPNSLSNISSELVSTFSINTFFDQKSNKVEAHFYTLDGTYINQAEKIHTSQLLGSSGAGQKGATRLTLDPKEDVIQNGYTAGDVRILYNFLDNLFSGTSEGGHLFVESISPDRLELRAYSNEVSDEDLKSYVTSIKSILDGTSHFSEFYLNFGTNILSTGVNIGYEETPKGVAVAFKLYSPLSRDVVEGTIFTVHDKVSDSVLFEVTTEYVEDKPVFTQLQGPNFNVEVTVDNNNPTEYFDYNELFSYPVTSSYYELYSLFNEKSAQISIDHTDYSNFIHFSSAEERLRNFKYKLDLIQSYQGSLDLLTSSGYTQTGISGSREYYENLIKGIVNNFDHYDRFLYYESGSKAWPKSTSSKPFINQASTTPESILWFSNQITSASNYDTSNFDILINTVPTYIREDSNNEPYLMFLHMIGNHFDNLWIYFKAVSDKYDADNRLDFGISKDLVRDAIESIGIKLYNSNFNLENLFSIYSGEGYISGSELITTHSVITSGSVNSYLQPVPKDNYQKEVYKRIYHNIPHLVKTKGTERGLRALINCFGIPDDILKIKTFGGVRSDKVPFFGPLTPVSSSLDKIRTDNTGSYITGSTLSKYTSIVRKDNKYTDDQNVVEVGFNLSDETDNYLNSQVSSTFNIDDYIGDPRSGKEPFYDILNVYVNSLDLSTKHVTGQTGTTTTAGVTDTSFTATITDDLYTSDVFSDGSIIVAGGSGTGYILRLNSDGSANSTFNGNLPSFNNTIKYVKVLSGGKIAVGGNFTGYLKRLNSDGTEDITFNTNLFSIPSNVESIVELSDGSLVITGGPGGTADGFLLKVNPDGTKDTTFAYNAGTLTGGQPLTLTLLSSNNLLVGGYFTGYLKKFSLIGVEDTTFATNLPALSNAVLGTSEFSDGSILIGGVFSGYVKKLNFDGTEVISFGTNAALTSFVTAIAIDSLDNVYVGGAFTGYLKKFSSTGVEDTVFTGNVSVNISAIQSINTLANSKLFVVGGTIDYLKRVYTITTSYQEYYYAKDPKALIRLVKFFDTTIFRMIKDFLPGRTKAATGIVVRPHKLHRSKAKQVQVSVEEKQYTGSIAVETISGSDAGSFGVANKDPYTTNYSSSYRSPLGRVPRNVTDEAPRVTGEFSGSVIRTTTGNLTAGNPFIRTSQPTTRFDFTIFNLSTPIPKACGINFTSTYLGEAFYFEAVNSGQVQLTSPVSIALTGSFNYAHNFGTDGATLTAAAQSTGGTFQGWYTTPTTGGTLVTSNTSLTINYNLELQSGSNYYARFTV